MATQQPGWLLSLIPNISQVQNAGGALPQRPVINVTGAGASVTDDPVNNRTNLAITGGGIAPAQTLISLIDGLNDNVSVPGGSVTTVRFTGWSSAVILGGLAFATAPIAGQVYTFIFAVSGYQVSVANLSATSSSGNRILTGTGVQANLPVGGEVTIQVVYDGALGNFVLQNTAVDSDPTYYAKNFGANGDGVTTTDGAAIQAAITALGSTGGTVKVGPGTFLCGAEVTVAGTGVTLEGCGSQFGTGTLLKANAPMRSVLNVANQANRVKDVNINANGLANFGVNRNNDSFGRYENVGVTNALYDGFHEQASGDTTTISAVTHAGSMSAPYPTVAWAPGTSPILASSGSCTMTVKVSTGGALGTAAFEVNYGSGYSSPVTSQANGLVQFANGSWASGLLWTFPANTYILNDTFAVTIVLAHNSGDYAKFDNCRAQTIGQIYGSDGAIDMLGASQYGLAGWNLPLYSGSRLTGTVTMTQSSAVLVGSGTNFTKSGARCGDFIRFGFPTWAATTAYSSSTPSYVTPGPTTAPGWLYVWKCTTSGTSGGSAPAWPTAGLEPGSNPIGMTVTDGSAVWTCWAVTTFQILCVQDDTHVLIWANDSPYETVAGLDYAICVGSGRFDEISSDCSQTHWLTGSMTACAAVGYMSAASVGDQLQTVQGQFCGIAAASFGVAGSLNKNMIANVLYSEGNLVCDSWCAAQGLTLIEPEASGSNGGIFNPDQIGATFGIAINEGTISPIGTAALITVPTQSVVHREVSVVGPITFIDYPTVDTTYLVNSSAGAVAVILGAPPSDIQVTFVDVTQSWGTHAFSFEGGGGWNVRDPANPEGSDGRTIYGTDWVGGSITFEASVGETEWYPVAIGCIPQTGTVHGILVKTTLLTSGTSFTTQSTTNSMLIRGCGGGGAGGGCTSVSAAAGAAGGGGAGGYLEAYVAAAPTTAYTYSIGSGGTGVSAGTGNNGGASTFTADATTYTAHGGAGAVGVTSAATATVGAPGAGGAIDGNGESVDTGGQPGSPGHVLIAATPIMISGNGGSGPMGTGGLGVATAGTGGAGKGYGAGGAGAATGASAAQTGGAGTQGCWLVEEYT